MYRKTIILLITALLLTGAIQPASAAGGAIASKVAELRASNTVHPSPTPGPIASKIADIQSRITIATVRPTIDSRATLGGKVGELRLNATKAVVMGSINSAINSLDRFGDRIDSSRLTDDQKAELKSQIQANVTWLEGKVADVKASTTMAEVLANASQASDRWNGVLPGLKKEAGFMACDNVDATIVTARNVSSVVSGRIDALKAQGKDTSSLEKALAGYNGHVDDAVVHVASARSDFSAISGKNDGHYAAGVVQLNEAAADLKNAYTDLKTIYRLFYGNSVQVS